MNLADYGSSTKPSRGSEIVRILIALAFVVLAGGYAASHGELVSNVSILAIAAAFGAYMALNIGANSLQFAFYSPLLGGFFNAAKEA